MADQNRKKYIKYEDTTYILEDSRIPDPTSADNGKVLGVVNGAYALKTDEAGGGSGGGSGLTGTQIAALSELFRLAVYAEDATGAYEAFLAAFQIYQDGSVLTINGGVTASLSGTALTLS